MKINSQKLRKPRIGIMLGDAAGIGPEIATKLLLQEEIYEQAEIVVIGDNRVFQQAQSIIGTNIQLPIIQELPKLSFDNSCEGHETEKKHQNEALHFPCLLNLPGEDPENIPVGKVSKEAGLGVYNTIDFILKLIKEQKIEGFLFAPFNKESLQLGGCPYHSEFLMFMDYFNIKKVHGEINILDELWTTRVTSHIAVKDISQFIKKQRIYETVTFINREMKKYGISNPKIAVSALNPHGGENGLFGREELDDIKPAVTMARDENIEAYGPFPCDTVFLRVEKEGYHAVVSMYHDQGQIATKLLGFERGVTLHGGMPVPVATCAHGTAFDIAGKGIAQPTALRAAFDVVCRIANTNMEKGNDEK